MCHNLKLNRIPAASGGGGGDLASMEPSAVSTCVFQSACGCHEDFVFCKLSFTDGESKSHSPANGASTTVYC